MSSSSVSQLGPNQISEVTADVPRPTPARVIPREFLPELQAAASMIMSREECAALQQEFDHLQQPHSAAA